VCSPPRPQSVCSPPRPQSVCSPPRPQSVCSPPRPQSVCSPPRPQRVCSPPRPQSVCSPPRPQSVCSPPRPQRVCSPPRPQSVCSPPRPQSVCSPPRPQRVCSPPRPQSVSDVRSKEIGTVCADCEVLVMYASQPNFHCAGSASPCAESRRGFRWRAFGAPRRSLLAQNCHCAKPNLSAPPPAALPLPSRRTSVCEIWTLSASRVSPVETSSARGSPHCATLRCAGKLEPTVCPLTILYRRCSI
uniref:Uncharacterized protein n=1 Tax=Myripristis murdjan TaxID=586833 RepID=A0A667WIA4_9TELE